MQTDHQTGAYLVADGPLRSPVALDRLAQQYGALIHPGFDQQLSCACGRNQLKRPTATHYYVTLAHLARTGCVQYVTHTCLAYTGIQSYT